MVKMVWDTDSGEAARSVASQYCKKPNAAGHGESHTHLRLGWVTRRRLQLFAYAALAVNQSQQLLLEADIRFRAHQYLQMLAIVGNVLADALNNMLDAGRIWLGE